MSKRYELTAESRPAKAVNAVQEVGPVLVFIEQRVGRVHASSVIKELRSEGLLQPVIVLATEVDAYLAAEVGQAGAAGYVLKKDLKSERFTKTVNRVLKESRGQQAAHADLAKTLMQMAGLTNREREVLEQIVAGLTNKQIADEMHRSVETIKVHRSHIMTKLEAKSTADLVRRVTLACHCS